MRACIKRWVWVAVTMSLCWAQARAADAADAAEEGLAIMASRNAGNCITCHDIPAWRDNARAAQRMTLQGTFGPSLAGVGQRYTQAQLRQWVVDARVMHPDTLMPPYGTSQGLSAPARAQSLLDAVQIDAVVAALSRFTEPRASMSTSTSMRAGVSASTSAPASISESAATAPTSASAPTTSSAAQLQSMQDMNPVGFWVEQGQQAWSQNCISCHALTQVVEQVPRFPRLDDQHRLINLEDQITQCRQRVNAASPATPARSNEDTTTLSLSAYLHDAARHRKIQMTPPSEPVAATAWQQHLSAGERLYNTRIGHMNLSCRQCHDDKVGASMRAQRIPAAHPVGFPVYRISWQGMGSIDRRIRACFSGVQAQVPVAKDQRLRQLELYLKYRAQGMPLEGPSVTP